LEEAWFDLSKGVETSEIANLEDLTLLGNRRDANRYVPVRPSTAQCILRDLPIRDAAEYVFIDLGSGKGRMLLIAAEHPFREVQGIEFALELHRQAEANIERYRSRKRRCSRVRSLAMNIADYAFPEENLVIYLFNSFGQDVMEQMLKRLQKSLRDHPRDVIIVMLFPDFSYLVDACGCFILHKQRRRYRIYRSCACSSSADHDQPSAVRASATS
jgi:hypothetical protein